MIPPTTTTQKIHTTRNRQRTTNNSDEATNRHPGSNEISYFHRRRLREPRTGTADTGGGGVGGGVVCTVEDILKFIGIPFVKPFLKFRFRFF